MTDRHRLVEVTNQSTSLGTCAYREQKHLIRDASQHPITGDESNPGFQINSKKKKRKKENLAVTARTRQEVVESSAGSPPAPASPASFRLQAKLGKGLFQLHSFHLASRAFTPSLHTYIRQNEKLQSVSRSSSSVPLLFCFAFSPPTPSVRISPTHARYTFCTQLHASS
jgi:hypothetical protein